MELLQLIYFCDAAESENFSVTARKYNVPPSGVSQTVKRLEEELSVKLFVRTSNRITLSEEGKIFYGGAKAALSSLEKAKAQIKETSSEPSGEIRLAVRAHRRTVTEAIERFRRCYPHVSFVITHGTDRESYDFIITADGSGIAKYRKKELIKEKMLLAISDSSEYKGDKLYNYRDEGFVTMRAGTDFSRVLNSICLEEGFSPNIVIQCEDPFYVRKYVEMGMGITLTPSISWKGMFTDNVRLIDLGEIYRNIYLYHKPEAEMSRVAKLFSEYILETFEKEL